MREHSAGGFRNHLLHSHRSADTFSAAFSGTVTNTDITHSRINAFSAM